MSTYTHDYTAEYLSLFAKSGIKRQISDTAVLAKIGAAPASHVDVHASDTDYGHVMASSSNPLANGTANPGTSLKYAREDHVHPAQDASHATDADFAKALKNPFMLYLEGAVTAEDRVDGNTDVHLRIIKLDATALEGLISLDNLPVGTDANSIAAGNHTHDYSSVYAALVHGHSYAGSSSDGGAANAAHTLYVGDVYARKSSDGTANGVDLNIDHLDANGFYLYGDTQTSGRWMNSGVVLQFSDQNEPSPGTAGHNLTQIWSSKVNTSGNTENKLGVRWRNGTGSWTDIETIITSSSLSTALSSYSQSSHGHPITTLTLASAQSDLPGGNTTPATDSGWLFLASDNNAAHNEHPHWARLLPTHIYIADTTSGSGGHSVIINEKGEATLSSVAISQGTNPQVIGMLPSSVNNSDHITPFDLYEYAAKANHNHSGVYAPYSHDHTSSDITDLSTVLSTVLSGYSQIGHYHEALSLASGGGLKYASGTTYTGETARTLSIDVAANLTWTGTHKFGTAPQLKIAGILACAGTSSTYAAITKVDCSTNGYVLKYNNGYTFGPITKGMLPSDYHYKEHTYLELTGLASASSPNTFTHNAGTDQTVYLIIPNANTATEYYVRIPTPSVDFAGDQIKFVVVNAKETDTPYEPIIYFVKTATGDVVIGEQRGTSGIPTFPTVNSTSDAKLRISIGETLILHDISTVAQNPTLNMWRAQKISETSF